MGEVRFYHLTTRPLESVLPVMLERVLARGTKAVVRGTSMDRLRHLDGHLWTYAQEGFLPHGVEGDPAPALQPIWLTDRKDIPNGADTLFLIDGAPAASDELVRMSVGAILFDGLDEQAVDQARAQWRQVTGDGLSAVYWAQTEQGAWTEKARA